MKICGFTFPTGAICYLNESVQDQPVREQMRITTVDEHFDEALAAIAEPSVADEAEAWLVGGAR